MRSSILKFNSEYPQFFQLFLIYAMIDPCTFFFIHVLHRTLRELVIGLKIVIAQIVTSEMRRRGGGEKCLLHRLSRQPVACGADS